MAIEKLEKRKTEIKNVFANEENKEDKVIIYEDWNLQDIADKINEIINFINELKKDE